ncbi:uncharacterized protein [Drosophila pseudoobscura]|uniref:Serine/arginine repetitive matrix protein 2 n=1 Tax=Drosophila pseudoobscura pseudoobscura TaxID=46245 RepID=Q29GA1_DROPS|nr:uncharacterized protein LOC4814881 [Drosophila pseudoobscura]
MKKNTTKNLVKSKKMTVQSCSEKLHQNQNHTKNVLAKVQHAFGTRFSEQDLSMVAAPRLVEKSVWSSPQIGGSGGALKALAKNVANHLEQLNRATMKRVVAQVIAERHSLGEVADFKGHMYFARPDHINFTELIAQSKEAFDDLVQQKAKPGVITEMPQKMKTKPKMLPYRPSGRTQSCGVGLTRLDKLLTNKSMRSKKQLPRKAWSSTIKRFESPISVFHLNDEGSRSLNGVIIDDSHLPVDRRDILLKVSKRPRGASCAFKKKRSVKGTLSARSHEKDEVKSEPAAPAPPSRKSPQRTNTQDSKAGCKVSWNYDLPAGASHHPPPTPARSHKKKPKSEIPSTKLPSKKAKLTSKVGTKTPLLKRTYSRPWLVRRTKSHHSKRLVRLTGGFVIEKSPQEPKIEAAIHGQSKVDSHVAKQIKSVVFPWYTPYQFKGGAGTGAPQQRVKGNRKKPFSRGVSKGSPNRKARPLASRTSIKKSITKKKPQSKELINAKVNFNIKPKNKKKSPAATIRAAPKPLIKAKTLTTKRSRYNRLQARLIRDLKREEAIDEPERIKSGGQRRRNVAKLPQDTAEASVGKSRTSPRSSPAKCLGKRPPAPVALPAGRLGGSPAHSAVKSQTSIRRQRSRFVRVGSSLGSLACLGPKAASNNNSKTTLTPAKRNLTIAFFNKRLEERGQRQALRQPWK